MHMSMMQRRNPVLTDGVFLTPMSVSRMKSVKKNATGCFGNRRNHNHWTAVLCMVSKSDRRKQEKKTVHSEKLVFNLLCITLYKASRLKSCLEIMTWKAQKWQTWLLSDFATNS